VIQYPTRRWAALVFRTEGSVFPRVALRSLMFAGLAAAVVAVGEQTSIDLGITGAAHAMVGVALGLLLVFRTNASYDRYWEGRDLLGSIVNEARNLARQARSYLAPGAAARAEIGRLIPALYACIRRHLRGERQWPELEGVLDDAELAEIEGTGTPPLACAGWIADLLAREAAEDRLSEVRLQHIDATLNRLIAAMGGCERIARTPVPFAYAHHIKAFLFIFCLTAPLALLDTMGWGTPAATAVIVYGLYGIDEIGVEIEDPFGYDPNDLPLDEIGETIDRDVRATVG
jgi:putative membrane protein